MFFSRVVLKNNRSFIAEIEECSDTVILKDFYEDDMRVALGTHTMRSLRLPVRREAHSRISHDLTRDYLLDLYLIITSAGIKLKMREEELEDNEGYQERARFISISELVLECDLFIRKTKEEVLEGIRKGGDASFLEEGDFDIGLSVSINNKHYNDIHDHTFVSFWRPLQRIIYSKKTLYRVLKAYTKCGGEWEYSLNSVCFGEYGNAVSLYWDEWNIHGKKGYEAFSLKEAEYRNMVDRVYERFVHLVCQQ